MVRHSLGHGVGIPQAVEGEVVFVTYQFIDRYTHTRVEVHMCIDIYNTHIYTHYLILDKMRDTIAV